MSDYEDSPSWENEIDSLLEQVAQLTKERDAMAEKLRIAVEALEVTHQCLTHRDQKPSWPAVKKSVHTTSDALARIRGTK